MEGQHANIHEPCRLEDLMNVEWVVVFRLVSRWLRRNIDVDSGLEEFPKRLNVTSEKSLLRHSTKTEPPGLTR